jgi:hypothetical protein
MSGEEVAAPRSTGEEAEAIYDQCKRECHAMKKDYMAIMNDLTQASPGIRADLKKAYLDCMKVGVDLTGGTKDKKFNFKEDLEYRP